MGIQTEIQRRNILRQNNAESNALTRECIEAALIELMKTHSFDEISITDIAKRAGVSRNAYYRNYSSKEDILSGYLQNLIFQMSEALKKSNPVTETKQSWLTLLTIVKEFYPQYKLLIDAGYSQNITDEMLVAINKAVAPENTGLYYSNCYWAGAICTVVTEWVKNGMDASVDGLSEICCRLMQDGIRTITSFGNR